MASTTVTAGPPKVVIHVGAPKTGTTFLQEILWQNRNRLADDGVLLPGTKSRHFHATLAVREVPLDRHPAVAAESWQRLADEVREWNGTAIISHELFAGASQEQAERALQALHPADVHIIYTARDLGRQIPAEWQEHLKHRTTIGMDEFVREVVECGPLAQWFWRVQDPADVLRRWGKTLPANQLHLLTVPPAGADSTLLWRRFASLIGVGAQQYDTTHARPNVSLGAAEAEVLRRVNRALGEQFAGPGVYARFAKEILAHEELATRTDKVKFGVRPHQRAWLEERSRQLIADIASLGIDVVGDLEELLPSNQQLGGAQPDDIGDSAITAVAVETIGTLLERLRDQEERLRDQEERLRDQEVVATERDAALEIVREHRDLPPRERVKRLVVELAGQSRGVATALSAYRRMRAMGSRAFPSGSAAHR